MITAGLWTLAQWNNGDNVSAHDKHAQTCKLLSFMSLGHKCLTQQYSLANSSCFHSLCSKCLPLAFMHALSRQRWQTGPAPPILQQCVVATHQLLDSFLYTLSCITLRHLSRNTLSKRFVPYFLQPRKDLIKYLFSMPNLIMGTTYLVTMTLLVANI